jgi:hypothetical protein
VNNRTRTKIRWAVIVFLLVCGCTYWLVFDSKIGSALFLANGMLQLVLEIRRGIPIRFPCRRKPIIIERLRYPNG